MEGQWVMRREGELLRLPICQPAHRGPVGDKPAPLEADLFGPSHCVVTMMLLTNFSELSDLKVYYSVGQQFRLGSAGWFFGSQWGLLTALELDWLWADLG